MQTLEYKKSDAASAAMIARVVERLRVMADEQRIRLLLRLKKGRATVTELSEDLEIAQPSVSKHLLQLRQVGLVQVERVGVSAFYSIKDQTIFDLCAIVCAGVTEFAREQHAALGLDLPATTKRGSK